MECYNNLVDAIAKRKNLEAKGTPDEEMPKMLDKLMFSIEKITGMDWNDSSEEEIKKEIDEMIQDKVEEYIKSSEMKKKIRKDAKKSLKDEMKDIDSKISEAENSISSIYTEYAAGNKVVHELIDLALLQNGMLKGEALAAFIRRSTELI